MRRKSGRWSSCGLLSRCMTGYGNTRGRLDGGRRAGCAIKSGWRISRWRKGRGLSGCGSNCGGHFGWRESDGHEG